MSKHKHDFPMDGDHKILIESYNRHRNGLSCEEENNLLEDIENGMIDSTNNKDSHYNKLIFGRGEDRYKSIIVDTYSVLDAFKTNSSAIDHAIKKLLCGGVRSGGKSLLEDYKEAISSIERAIESIDARENKL